jgi:uncharacterized protein YjlB
MQEPDAFNFADDGTIPNNPLPLLLYRSALRFDAGPAAFEQLFARHGWGGMWRNGIYDFHHFHSTAHEVLGIAAGRVRVRFGGPAGETVGVQAGDIVVIPAGVGHLNEGASPDLLVVGAYPQGQCPDLRRGDPGEHGKMLDNIAAVPLPARDPVTGLPVWR